MMTMIMPAEENKKEKKKYKKKHDNPTLTIRSDSNRIKRPRFTTAQTASLFRGSAPNLAGRAAPGAALTAAAAPWRLRPPLPRSWAPPEGVSYLQGRSYTPSRAVIGVLARGLSRKCKPRPVTHAWSSDPLPHRVEVEALPPSPIPLHPLRGHFFLIDLLDGMPPAAYPLFSTSPGLYPPPSSQCYMGHNTVGSQGWIFFHYIISFLSVFIYIHCNGCIDWTFESVGTGLASQTKTFQDPQSHTPSWLDIRGYHSRHFPCPASYWEVARTPFVQQPTGSRSSQVGQTWPEHQRQHAASRAGLSVVRLVQIVGTQRCYNLQTMRMARVCKDGATQGSISTWPDPLQAGCHTNPLGGQRLVDMGKRPVAETACRWETSFSTSQLGRAECCKGQRHERGKGRTLPTSCNCHSRLRPRSWRRHVESPFRGPPAAVPARTTGCCKVCCQR